MNQTSASSAQAGAGLIGSIAQWFSDERVKTNIERLPYEAAPGVPLAAFSYRGHPGQKYVGVIAQDLEKVSPEKVQEGPDGLKRVGPEFAPFALGPKRKG